MSLHLIGSNCKELIPFLATIIHLMEFDQLYKRKPYKKDSADIKSLLRIKKSLVLTKGILFRKSFTDNTSSKKIIWQLVLPNSHRHQAILGCHDEVGHQGRVRDFEFVERKIFFGLTCRLRLLSI